MPRFCETENVHWVMPGPASAERGSKTLAKLTFIVLRSKIFHQYGMIAEI